MRQYGALLLAGVLLGGCAAEISYQQGEAMMAQARWGEAVQFYQDAAKQDPRNVEVRLGLARSMFAAGEDWANRGAEAEKGERIDEALVAYRRALAYNAENTAALAGLDRLGRAQQVQERLIKARERMEAKEWRAAHTEVAAALRLNPDHAGAKALKQEITRNLAGEAPPSKAETDTERLAAQLFAKTPVTLRFRDTDIKEVLEVLSRTAGVNIIADESLQPKRVTTFFKDLPLREAFNLILTSNRLFAKKVADNTVIVVPDNPAKRQQYDELVVQTFYLTDADAKVVVNLLRTLLNTRQVFVNEKLNAISVRDTPDKIDLARKILEANDRGIGEVEVDLEVLEVDRNSLQNMGIDISPRTLSVGLVFPQTIPLGDVGAAMQLTSLALSNPSLIINLVKNDGTTKILASPTVRVLDRQKARLMIGERRPFLISSLSSVPATAGGTQTPTGAVTTTEQRVEYRDIGLKLTMTPIIHLNGEVTVELNFEISNVGAPITGTTGGQLLPPINTRNLDTFIKVRNGETRLLGGLLLETESIANSRVPFLSDLPGLGRLFVSGDQNRVRSDVLISLTPRIVKALERPDPEIESFLSGTADSFGPAAPGAPMGPAQPGPAPARPGGPAAPPPPAAPRPSGAF
jgi:general secretion pathway protein D